MLGAGPFRPGDHIASTDPRRLRRAFFIGVVTGIAYFAGTLYWITEVMVTFGGLAPALALVLNGLLVLFLALFPGACLLGLGLAIGRMGPSGLLLAPAFWVTTELGREHLFGGFPWVLLGYSQATVLPIAQLASVAGVYGVSGLVAVVNAGVVQFAFGRGRRRWLTAGVALASIGVLASWGAWRIGRADLTRAGAPIVVGLVQGNVPQEQKWDPAYRRSILDRYLTMTREAASRGARFVLWPESATPFYFEEDPAGGQEVRRVAAESGVNLLVGSDQLEPGRIYNAAFLVGSDGRTAAVYRKIHLVPFGEYIPFGRLLSFADPLVEGVGNFSPGSESVLLPIGDHRASTAICYEVVYPSLIRRFVDAGSELLTTITNDAWYGHSSAPYQHFEQAAMRAIEQGRYLARAANTGVSGIVDPYGRVLARSEIFTAASLVGEVRFLSERSIYGRIGDAFAYLCLAVTLASLVAAVPSRHRTIARGGQPASDRRRE
jgi:apolipoprotein N-acyltransferase